MKNLYKLRMALTLVVMIAGMATAMAQTSMPIPSGNLYEKGTNSSGSVASESPDLITTGTKVPYLVVPDATLNPNWAAAAAANATVTTGLNSTFTWGVPGLISTSFSAAANTTHYIEVDVDGTAGATVRQITVQENSASCSGSSSTIDVRIVSQPSASALTATDGTAPLNSICLDGTNTQLNVPLPAFKLTYSKDAAIPGDATVQVIASLSFTALNSAGPAVPVFTDKVLNIDQNTGNIVAADLTALIDDLDDWGTYTLTISKISDKISRKDLDATRKGFFSVAGVSTSYTVLKTPTTGPIYHLPNN